MSDIKNANLLHKTLKVVKNVLLTKRIQDLRVSDILIAVNISKSKFFSFFGSMNTILELVILDELKRNYSLISESIKNSKNQKAIESEILLLRLIYFRKNSILHNYFENISLLPNRFDELKEAVYQRERNFQFEILRQNGIDYRSAWISKMTLNIN